MSVLVVGSVAFDAIETPFGKTDKIIGGAATYISYVASYFTHPVYLVSVVGDDFPQATLVDLAGRGVDLAGLEIRPGEKSFFWSGKYHNDLNTRDTLDTQLNVLAAFDPKVPQAAYQADYVLLGNLDPDVQAKVLDQLPQRPKLVVLDTMNFWMDIKIESLHAVLKRIDVLTINDEEARQLSGEYSLVKAAQKIQAMGPDYLVIKKGEHGALLFHEDKVFFAPALPLEEVFDPTGAGDCFAGGFVGYLAQQDDTSFDAMKRAVVYGSAMASFCVEAFGPERVQNLDTKAIADRVDRFRHLMNVVIN